MKRGIRLYDLQSLRKGNKQAIDKRQEGKKKEKKTNQYETIIGISRRDSIFLFLNQNKQDIYDVFSYVYFKRKREISHV